MARLRVRFSGMCLFHEQNGGVVVRVLKAVGHRPELWVDPATATVETSRQPDSQDECILQNGAAGLSRQVREVRKYQLDGEHISFANGDGSGPTQMPDVVSLAALHPGISAVDTGKPVGAVISLNRGKFISGPPIGVQWNGMPQGLTGPPTLPVWTDLVIETSDPTFRIDSDKGGWKLTPTGAGDVEVWVLSDVATGTGALDHFTHFFEFLTGAASLRPYPTLGDGVRLPDCPDESGVGRGRASLLVAGNTFCPDGKR